MEKIYQETLEAYQNIQLVKKHLSHVHLQLEAAHAQLLELEWILDKEQRDVEALEKTSLTSIFYKLLGNKEQQLEKEKQEYLQAFLQYQDGKKSIELLEFEKKVLKEKLLNEKAIKIKLRDLKRQREIHLIKNDKIKGKEILQFDSQIEEKLLLQRELREALIVGIKAKDELEKITIQLKRSPAWGQWEAYHGLAKLSFNSIDKARNHAISAKQFLSELELELRDIYGRKRFKIASLLNHFLYFTDEFNDNLISDWIVAERIRNVSSGVLGIKDKLIRINNTLRIELKQADIAIKYLESQKEKVLNE